MRKKKPDNQLTTAINKILNVQRKGDTMNDLEKFYFAEADKLREKSPGPRHKVGAIIVHQGEVVGKGYNHPRNVTNEQFLAMPREQQLQEVVHAEEDALRDALKTITVSQLADATMYVVGLWPCESCAVLLASYKVGNVKSQLKYNTPQWIVEGMRGTKVLAKAGTKTNYYID